MACFVRNKVFSPRWFVLLQTKQYVPPTSAVGSIESVLCVYLLRLFISQRHHCQALEFFFFTFSAFSLTYVWHSDFSYIFGWTFLHLGSMIALKITVNNDFFWPLWMSRLVWEKWRCVNAQAFPFLLLLTYLWLLFIIIFESTQLVFSSDIYLCGCYQSLHKYLAIGYSREQFIYCILPRSEFSNFLASKRICFGHLIELEHS